MSKFKEPIFTRDELDARKTGISIGYSLGELISGHDFAHAFKNKLSKKFIEVTERIDGTSKKRAAHEKINSFGWATFNGDELFFGVRFTNGANMTSIGESALKKYKQLLGFLLEQAGWKNIQLDEYGNYAIPLDNSENIELLYKLSPSIGFYYKSEAPDMKDLEKLKLDIKYKNMQYKDTSKKR